MNNVKVAMLRAAGALRKVAAENEALKNNSKLYKECIKLAFDMASRGQIEDSGEAIMTKADELMNNKDQIPVIKEAMKMTNPYLSVGSVEKTASLAADTGNLRENEIKLLNRLNEIL